MANILFVDDDPGIIEALVERYTFQGHRIVVQLPITWDDGNELLQKAETVPRFYNVYDLIICDQRCGGREKFADELAKKLWDKEIETPVICYSAEVDPANPHDNVLAYVSKTNWGELDNMILQHAKSTGANHNHHANFGWD